MTRIRTGTNHLEIEIGRHKKMERHLRLCRQCENKEVENEKHFLIRCTKYEMLRQQLFDKIERISNNKWKLKNLNDDDKFIFLLNGSGDQYQMKIYQCTQTFLKNSWQARS